MCAAEGSRKAPLFVFRLAIFSNLTVPIFQLNVPTHLQGLRNGLIANWLFAARGHLPPSRFLRCYGPSDLWDTRADQDGEPSCVAFASFRAGFHFLGAARHPLLTLPPLGVTPQAVPRHGKHTWYRHSLQSGHLRIRQSRNRYPAMPGSHPIRFLHQDSGCGPRMGAHNPDSYIGLRSCANFSRRPPGPC